MKFTEKALITFLILIGLTAMILPPILIWRGTKPAVTREETNTFDIYSPSAIYNIENLDTMMLWQYRVWHLEMTFQTGHAKYKISECYPTLREALNRSGIICPTCYE